MEQNAGNGSASWLSEDLKKAQQRLDEKRQRLTSPEKRKTTPKVSDTTFCREHGVAKKRVGLVGDQVIFVCPECERRIDGLVEESRKVQDAEAKAVEQKRIRRLFAECQMGKRFANCTFDSYHEITPEAGKVRDICRTYAEHFDDALAQGAGLIMCGKPGTGKNHLAAAICNTVMSNGHSSLHTTVMRMIRRIKSTWSRESEETEQKAIRAFCEPELLVIDEVGVQFGSDTEKLLLTEIINDRYERFRPTILISNLTAKQLTETLGERVIDRFRDGGSLLAFTWNSYRQRG